ncbi:hypothetical protein RhiirB3_390685 [Rhizophagus irregularis]|nr:hypothetical protein RhiirB3_390685 [Rhizophagus irregularis]
MIMSTSEQYPGYKRARKLSRKLVISWVLLFHHDDIIASLSSNKWKKLNNFWMNSFLKKARKLITNQEIYNALEEKVEIPDEHYDELVNLQLHKNKELLATKKISKYFIKDPVDKHIHTIVSLPETTKTRQELELTELELINKVAELQDPSLSVFSLFNCGFIDLNDEKSQVIIKHLMTDLNFRFKAIPIGNEASKSQYVCSYLVAIANLFEDKFKICPEKNVSGLNGHGPVDFALIQVQTSRIIGITEVKDKDFQQGVAQNAVQCESALSSSKKKVFGIITDSEKWFFLECSLDNKRNPKFKLSKPVVIIYGDEDMENWVKKVLGHIAWLLEEAQKLNELEDKN